MEGPRAWLVLKFKATRMELSPPSQTLNSHALRNNIHTQDRDTQHSSQTPIQTFHPPMKSITHTAQ
jgi:hypothetical protein